MAIYSTDPNQQSSPAVTATWTSATAINTTVVIPTLGFGTVCFSLNPTVTITGGAAVLFEGSNDNQTTWYECLATYPTAPTNLYNGLNATANGLSLVGAIPTLFTANVSGLTHFRIRLSVVITSGTEVITLIAFSTPLAPPTTGVVAQGLYSGLNPVNSTLGNYPFTINGNGALIVIEDAQSSIASSTAVTGAAVSLTFNAGNTGTYHRFSMIEITKYFTAANAASATPLSVTTTNLNGLIFKFGQPLGTIGTAETRIYSFTPRLNSLSPATNTSITCPATTGIIWNLNVIWTTF
jgi:hypothetical protein